MKQIKQLSIICLFMAVQMNLFSQGYKLPDYKSFKLDNGLTVYLMELHDVPVISVSAILPAGAIYDGSKAGLASFTATALKHGTKNFTKAQLDEEIDFIGARVNTSASKEYARLSAKFASKDKDKMLPIIQEVLLEPSFNAEEFEKEKSRILVQLEQQKESPRSVIRAYFDDFLFGDHVYGNSTGGIKPTVNDLTVNDLKNFYKANYVPNEAAISIVGDFSSAAMQKQITALFSGWQKNSGSSSPNLASKPIAKPSESRVLLVNKDDAKETTFYIGSLGVSRNNPDLVSIDVVNTLFGGRFTSMLNDALRVNSGLTYGARSGFSSLKNGGSFGISTFTALETSEAAIDMALDVLNKLHTNGLDQQSLTSAKNYVKGQFPPDYETAEQLAGLLTEMFWYNFDESYINHFEKNVDDLDLAKANKIIADYFPKDKLQFVIVGKSSEIKKIVEKYGKVTEVQIKDDMVRKN